MSVELRFKIVHLLFCLATVQTAFAQPANTFVDFRDGQTYRFTAINGTTWMLDNLNYKTLLSMEADTTKEHAPSGRFYHIQELDSVCPVGWQVSTKDDWLTYMEHIIESANDSTLKITENKLDEIVEIDYWDKIDMSKVINPLDIQHTAWVEGGRWIDSKMMDPVRANFWATEPHRDELERTHVHVMADIRIRIHRHKHHLKPNQEKKLRRFMVRCTKIE